jgi:hypothetical protein
MTTKARQPDEPYGYTVDGVLALAGGRGAVAKAIGVSVQTVAKWARRIPDRHARQVAILAGLPLEIVRPDLVHSGHDQAKRYVGAMK